MKTTKAMKIGNETHVATRSGNEQTRQEPACADEVKETCAAPHVSFNNEKKQWQTPDGRLFGTLKKAQRHLLNSI